VWGQGYNYFEQLEEVKAFKKEQDCDLFAKVRSCYKILSKYVHSSVSSFQTRPDRISPRYVIVDFTRWSGNYRDVQSLVNVILILGFAETFKSSTIPIQRIILKVIDKRNYKNGLRTSLKLKIPGRI